MESGWVGGRREVEVGVEVEECGLCGRENVYTGRALGLRYIDR